MECLSKGVCLQRLLTYYIRNNFFLNWRHINYVKIYKQMHFQQCDLVFNDNAMTPEQNKILEMIPYITSYFDFIFQVTDSTANISAIAKPFQWTV